MRGVGNLADQESGSCLQCGKCTDALGKVQNRLDGLRWDARRDMRAVCAAGAVPGTQSIETESLHDRCARKIRKLADRGDPHMGKGSQFGFRKRQMARFDGRQNVGAGVVVNQARCAWSGESCGLE